MNQLIVFVGVGTSSITCLLSAIIKLIDKKSSPDCTPLGIYIGINIALLGLAL
jgi:hypothetical protein